MCVGDHAAVLCGKQWIALPQLLNLREAQRIGGGVAAAGGVSVRTGHRDEFNELVGTLATEIARRLPRYPVFLQVYDLVHKALTCTHIRAHVGLTVHICHDDRAKPRASRASTD